MKPLIIYHSNCADGFSAAWCFWRRYGSEADYHPGVYQESPPNCTGRDVYLVDFSYKRAVVEAMLMVARKITLIDHRQSDSQRDTMTVADLIAELQKLPQHRPVRVLLTECLDAEEYTITLSEADAREAAEVRDYGSHVLITSK